MFWCFTAGFDHMVNAYEATEACINTAAVAVVSINAVAVDVRMSHVGNHLAGGFVNRNFSKWPIPLLGKGNHYLARVAR